MILSPSYLLAFLTVILAIYVTYKLIKKKVVDLPEPQQADIVIIGLGTAGSVLARRLNDSLSSRIVVLERGKDRSDDSIVYSL